MVPLLTTSMTTTTTTHLSQTTPLAKDAAASAVRVAASTEPKECDDANHQTLKIGEKKIERD
jgi:hypothetical protein